MGNPLLGEETGPPVRLQRQRRHQKFAPAAAASDNAMVLPSDRPGGGARPEGTPTQRRSMARIEAAEREASGLPSPETRSHPIPSRRGQPAPPTSRPRTVDPVLHPQEPSQRRKLACAPPRPSAHMHKLWIHTLDATFLLARSCAGVQHCVE
jgi:hypothetical protein